MWRMSRPEFELALASALVISGLIYGLVAALVS